MLFWGDLSEAAANRNLRNSLYRLKKSLLPRLPAHPNFLQVTNKTVMISAEAGVTIDAARFNQLWAQCTHVPRETWLHDSVIVAALREMAQLYQGSFLDGVLLSDCIEFDNWLMQQQEEYHERALTVLHALTERAIERGRFDEAVQLAERQLTMEAWHEPAYRQLIKSHLLSGRSEVARQQFERCRTMLQTEFGSEPSAATVALLATASQQPGQSRRKRRRSARCELNLFFGRQQEFASLQELLLEGPTRLVTLHGVGGIGKTRLARAVGQTLSAEFEDGVVFVPLVNVEQPDAIPSAIASALGLRPEGDQSLLDQLCDYLRQRDLLLILDNYEHLLTSDDAAIVPLLTILKATQDVVLLVTSRLRLGLTVEQLLRLDGLSCSPTDGNALQSEAAQLFITRVMQMRPTFDPEPAHDAIVAICQLVEGLPLGIELAAAQSATWSCESVAERLRADMAIEAPLRDIPPRQRSLAAVFDYSWQLLDEDLRSIAARAAIMRGSFAYEAFHAVTGGDHAQLEALLAHALIRQADDGRFDMHELVRRDALKRLHAEDRSSAEYCYAVYFLRFVVEQETELLDHMQPALPNIRRECHHIERAWQYAVDHQKVNLLGDAARALCTFWIVAGHSSSSLAMLETARAALAHADPQPGLAAASAHLDGTQIWIYFTTGHIKASVSLAQRLLHSGQDNSADPFAVVAATATLGSLQQIGGHLHSAEALLRRSYALAVEHDLTIWQSVASYVMLMILGNQARIDECDIWGRRAVACVAPNHYLQIVNEASWHYRTWRLSDCLRLAEESRQILRTLGERTIIDATFTLTGAILYRIGAFNRVTDLYNAARRDVVLDEQQFVRHAGYYVLAHAERRRGNLDAALHYGSVAVKHTATLAPGFYYVWAREAFALALCAAGRPSEAQAILLSAVEKLQDSDLADHWFCLIEGSLAHTYALSGHWETAHRIVDNLVKRLLANDYASAPIEQSWFCYQILHYVGDPRADTLLQHAYNVIQQRANLLGNCQHRALFFDNYAEHQAIIALVEQGVTAHSCSEPEQSKKPCVKCISAYV